MKCDLTPDEIAKLVNNTDVNFDGMIDLNEFMAIVNNSNARKNQLGRKITPMTFVSIFDGLPMNFLPSFIRDEQKSYKLLPSSTLIPNTDRTGILYQDILPNFTNNNNQTIATLRPIATKICAKITFSNATGISIPDEKVVNRTSGIAGRILKISYFDQRTDKFFGNSINLQVSWKKEYEDRWYFEDDRNAFNNSVIFRFNGEDMSSIWVIFEFVLMVKKDNSITEISCGWSSIDIRELQKGQTMKLEVKGGSPNKQEVINKSDIRARRSGFAKVAQLFSGDVKSLLPIEIKLVKDFPTNDKVIIINLVISRLSSNYCYNE
jgi:hypothetical protein